MSNLLRQASRAVALLPLPAAILWSAHLTHMPLRTLGQTLVPALSLALVHVALTVAFLRSRTPARAGRRSLSGALRSLPVRALMLVISAAAIVCTPVWSLPGWWPLLYAAIAGGAGGWIFALLGLVVMEWTDARTLRRTLRARRVIAAIAGAALLALWSAISIAGVGHWFPAVVDLVLLVAGAIASGIAIDCMPRASAWPWRLVPVIAAVSIGRFAVTAPPVEAPIPGSGAHAGLVLSAGLLLAAVSRAACEIVDPGATSDGRSVGAARLAYVVIAFAVVEPAAMVGFAWPNTGLIIGTFLIASLAAALPPLGAQPADAKPARPDHPRSERKYM